MVTLADIFRQYGPAYLEKYGQSMPAEHRKAMEALRRCRTGELGYALYRCDDCHSLQPVPRSCGNRHCPTCQAHKMQSWLGKQLRRLLPCPYFLVTFTVPQELRRLIRSNQKIGYEAMIQAAVGALRKLAADGRFVGVSQLGVLAVLHSWTRQLEYHPHVHLLVPAGGLLVDRGPPRGDDPVEEAEPSHSEGVAADGDDVDMDDQPRDAAPTPEDSRSRKRRQWRASPAHFFVPVAALSVIYRAKMRDALDKAGLREDVPEAVWHTDWVVHSQAVGDGQHCLRYLAAYVFRVAISASRIVSCDDGQVAFLYRKSGSRRWRKAELEAEEFIRRFLQHVLPSGFMKVRHYGFLSPNSALSTDELEELIADYYGGLVEKLPPDERELPDPPQVTCPDCGGPMRLLRLILPEKAYQGSG